MTYKTVIATEELDQHLTDPNWVVVDCRFALNDTERGRSDYRQAHIPGAVYAHLDEDLSRPITPGKTGRHPLPEIETFAKTLSQWGVDAEVQVVAYDDKTGAIAARLWWLLRWLGHEAVAVLDGGWHRWQSEGRSFHSGVELRTARNLVPHAQPHLLVDTAEVSIMRTDPTFRLFDARSAERYRGENETLDSVAGHIPRAISAPYVENLGPDGRFKPVEALRTRFQDLLGDLPVEQIVSYCGSGVTAAHNLLALAHAGFGDGRLYAGSWSEWITDPDRPVETG